MAITGTKLFASGDVLTANDTNQYLMRGVKVFSSTAVRDAAYGGAGEPTLEEGETCYITATDELQTYNGSSWVKIGPATTPKILQVVTANKTASQTTTSTSYVDITGMSATITPTSATSTILIHVHMMGATNGTDVTNQVQLLRGATQIALGDAASNRSRVFNYSFQSNYYGEMHYLGGTFIDSPATTSATTYKLQFRTSNGTVIATINQSGNDTDSSAIGRPFSSITLMEISA